MATSSLVEERLSAVEDAIRELRCLVSRRTPAPNWIERLTGSMKDEPAFDEVLEYGRALREADGPEEESQQ